MSYTFCKATYTTKVFSLGSRAVEANSLPFTSSTLLFVGKVLVIVYLFHFNFHSANHISVLNREKNDISNTTFMLVLATKKISSKNQFLLYLSYKEKLITTIS